MPLHQQASWVLKIGLDHIDKLGANCSVHDPVVERTRDIHPASNLNFIVIGRDYLLSNRGDRQDSAIRLVYDGDEVVDVKHSHVGNREGRPGQFI